MKKYTEQPLEYWEEHSCMQAVIDDIDGLTFSKILDRISAIEGIKIISVTESNEQVAGKIKVNYLAQEYEIGCFLGDLHLPDMILNGPYVFTPEESISIRNAKYALFLNMKFEKNPKKSYKFQLKLMMAMAPNLLAIVDESAEKLLPLGWIKMAIKSKTTPCAEELFTIHAVGDGKGQIWLHTHGLARCGTTELEILNSTRDNYNVHYNLLSAYASYLLDSVGEDMRGKGVLIGYFSNNAPILATCLSWTEALQYYSRFILGNAKDREEGHNTKTSPLFIYSNPNDEKNRKVSLVTDYNDYWINNPLFFISDTETRIRTVIAKERFYLLEKAFENKDSDILVKIALPLDNGSNEHIYFRLLSFEGDNFKAELLQEPYADFGIHVGYQGEFSVDDVSDWVIYTPTVTITPKTAYLLEK